MQKENIYLRWLAEKTPTSWWNDSALLDDIANAASNGAMGVTTNPLLVKRALYHPARPWADLLKSLPKSLSGEEKAEELCRMMILKISETQMPLFRKTEGKHGWICAQVNPRLQGDREGMLAMARRIHAWAHARSSRKMLPNTAPQCVPQSASRSRRRSLWQDISAQA